MAALKVDDALQAIAAWQQEKAELLAALRELVRAWDRTTLPVTGGLEEALHDAEIAIAHAERAK